MKYLLYNVSMGLYWSDEDGWVNKEEATRYGKEIFKNYWPEGTQVVPDEG